MATRPYNNADLDPLRLHGPYVDMADSDHSEDEDQDAPVFGGALSTHSISLGQMVPRLRPTTVATHDATKTCNVVIDSADRNLFHESLFAFPVHFASQKSDTGGCSVERRLRDIIKIRCTQILFPIQNELYTTLYHADEAVSVVTSQRLHLHLDPLTRPREELAATRDDLQDAYMMMVPDSADYFTKFIPYDAAENNYDAPQNLQSLRVRVEPHVAALHEPTVRGAITRARETHSELALPTLDLYPFSAIVYNRVAKTLTVTFEQELDERLLAIGYTLRFACLTFAEEGPYERALRRRVDRKDHFVVVAVNKKGVERDTHTTNRFTVATDGYIDRVTTAVQLHFSFDDDEAQRHSLDAEHYSFDIDTRQRRGNVLLSLAMQYVLRLEIEYKARTLVTTHGSAAADTE